MLLHGDIFLQLQNDVTFNELQFTLQQLLGGVKIAVKNVGNFLLNVIGLLSDKLLPSDWLNCSVKSCITFKIS